MNENKDVFNTLLLLKYCLVKRYKILEHKRNNVKSLEMQLYKNNEKIKVLQKQKVVNLEKINNLLLHNFDLENDICLWKFNIKEFKNGTIRLEDYTFQFIKQFGNTLTRKQMETLTGGHFYLFNEADKWNEEQGYINSSFLDYVFDHNVEYVHNIQRCSDFIDCPTYEVPFFEACNNATLRATNDSIDAYKLIDMLQNIKLEEEAMKKAKHKAELESKYKIDKNIIKLL